MIPIRELIKELKLQRQSFQTLIEDGHFTTKDLTELNNVISSLNFLEDM